MKKFDGCSIRGVIFSVLGLAGIGYELFSSRLKEIPVVLLYSVLVFFGILLLFFITDREG